MTDDSVSERESILLGVGSRSIALAEAQPRVFGDNPST